MFGTVSQARTGDKSYDGLLDLLAVVADPKASAQRIKDLQKAEAAAKAARGDVAATSKDVAAKNREAEQALAEAHDHLESAKQMAAENRTLRDTARDLKDQAAAELEGAKTEAAAIVAHAKRNAKAEVEKQVRAAVSDAFGK